MAQDPHGSRNMAQVEPLTADEAPPARNRRADSDASAAAVTLDRYEIHPGRPLPAYDTPAAACYAVTDTKGARENLMALVARDRLPARMDILPSLRSTDCPFIIKAYRWAAIEWPGGAGRRFAILYSQPGGTAVMPSLASVTPIADDALIENVARPLATALAELSSRGIAHRAIRPDNIYFKDAAHRQVVLGDGAIAPAGSTNSPLFETIENGMADPLGRGPGSIADDLYSLGATLLLLSLGFNPVAGVAPDDLIGAKIAKGSYTALAGSHRVSSVLREAIRGLLADDPKERWTLKELSFWLDGRRLSPIQPTVPPHAGRPYPFCGGEYYSCRGLAHAIARNWAAANQAVREIDLEAWVKRSVGDGKAGDLIAEVLASGGDPARAAEGQVAARLCIALDPKGPLRFKNISATLDGIGPLLCGLAREPNGVQPFAQLIASDLPIAWIDKRYGDGPEARTLVKIVDRLRYFMKRPLPGHGVERCLYELNPALPCLSPMLEPYYVVDADSLLPALEAVAGSNTRPSFPIDRHIAAFIAARFGPEAEDHVEKTADRSDPRKAILAVLRTLSVMQWRLGPPQLPRLTAWMGKLAESIVDGYHQTAFRTEMKAQLERVIKKGSLIELLNFVDDDGARALDENGYRGALANFAAAEAEIDRLSSQDQGMNRRAQAMAGRVAGIISAVVITATIGILMLMRHHG